jgi:hypothetical protein
MKKRLFYILCSLVFVLSCSSDDDRRNNPFLVDIGFQVDLDTNLPQFASLNFPGNFVTVTDVGLRGIVIYNVDNSQYFVYELSDPNHSPNNCSRMTISGITATCPCPDDDNSYNIVNGQPTTGEGRFGLKGYRSVRSGSVIRVSN